MARFDAIRADLVEEADRLDRWLHTWACCIDATYKGVRVGIPPGLSVIDATFLLRQRAKLVSEDQALVEQIEWRYDVPWQDRLLELRRERISIRILMLKTSGHRLVCSALLWMMPAFFALERVGDWCERSTARMEAEDELRRMRLDRRITKAEKSELHAFLAEGMTPAEAAQNVNIHAQLRPV